MSHSSGRIFSCLRWLCILGILYISTPSCEGLEKLCGKRLNEALELICGKSFARKTRKAIDPIDYYADFEFSSEEEANSNEMPSNNDISLLDKLPYLSKFPSNILDKTRPRRRQGGVANECCKKSCTMAELRTYCL